MHVNAPGSSRCGIAVPHTTGSFRGDTLVRHGVLGVVPTPRPQRGPPFAPRVPGGPFPRFNTTMGRCDSLPSISPRASFPSLGDTTGPSPVRPHQLGTRAVDQPGVGKPGLQPAVTMETARSPKFPRNPLDHFVPPFLAPEESRKSRKGTLVVFEELWGKWVGWLLGLGLHDLSA